MTNSEGEPETGVLKRGKLLIATDNPGKLAEYRALLGDIPATLTTPRQEGIAMDVEETGSTFRANAMLKASAYAAASGLLTIADDSGLEVDALGGAPGVHSRRFGSEHLTDAQRSRLLLDEMRDVPAGNRTARFQCVIAIAQPDGRTWTRKGACEGEIAFEPRGSSGFGYDPIFFLPEFGRTMAEVDPKVKNRISHRAAAVRKSRSILRKLLAP